MKISTVICGISAAVLVASCMNGGSYKSEYNDYCAFESSNINDYGNDSLYFESDFFQSLSNCSLVFHGKRDGDKITDLSDFRSGFLLSLLRDTLVAKGHLAEADPRKIRYSVVADTTGADNSKGFAVLCYVPGDMPEHSVSFAMTNYGTCLPRYVKVCNTSYVANTVTYGNAYCRAFEKGDYLKLSIAAVLNGVETQRLDYNLVKYDETGLKIVDRWEKFDLSKLGDFDYLEFYMDSNVPGAPLYCCIDGMVVSVSIER
ncbi:MAG: DUF4465 domain-containing protein [Bacteroidales bacterium]|nr:DUF4465 domain-containing protein [Bacteroidales bacterium]